MGHQSGGSARRVEESEASFTLGTAAKDKEAEILVWPNLRREVLWCRKRVLEM